MGLKVKHIAIKGDKIVCMQIKPSHQEQNNDQRVYIRHRDRQCLPDLIDPIYVARMILFLASDDAAMCTANNFMVEAGSV